MFESLEEEYLNWLAAKVVHDVDRPEWMGLLTVLQNYEFIPLLTGDHNRVEEGLDIRKRFLNETRSGEAPDEWMHVGCSMLELFMGFSIRAAWQTSEQPKDWFWRIIENLKLQDYQELTPDDVPDVEEILYTVVWRTYDEHGIGGMFPVYYSEFDQRSVEIWYQFCEYVEENQLI